MPYINRDICSHFYRYLNKKWRHSNICCIEKFLKSLFIVFLTLYVALYFCKAINDENKWKGKPSLLRVLLVLFKVGEKMQNKRMLTKIYHLSAILYTAPTSNGNWLSSALYWLIVAWNVLLKRKIRKKRGQLVSGAFTTSWRQKKKTERWSRCLFVHPSIPLEFSLQSRTRRGEG